MFYFVSKQGNLKGAKFFVKNLKRKRKKNKIFLIFWSGELNPQIFSNWSRFTSLFRVFNDGFSVKKCIWWRIASILSSLTCVLLENGLNCLLLLYKVRDTQLCVCTTIFLTLARFEIKVADRSTLCEEIQSKNRKGAAAEKKVKPKPSNNLP